MDIAPDGLRAALAREGGSVVVVDLDTDDVLSLRGGALRGSERAGLAFSRDGAFLVAAGGGRGRFDVWSTLDWSLRTFAVPGGVGNLGVTALSDGAVAVYERGAQHFVRFSPGDGGSFEGAWSVAPKTVRQVACSSCGRRVAVSFNGADVVGLVDSSHPARPLVLGFVRGPEGFGVVERLDFGAVEGGALLCVGWSSGALQFIELRF